MRSLLGRRQSGVSDSQSGLRIVAKTPGGDEVGGGGFGLTKCVAQRRQSDVGQPSRLEGCWEGRTIHPE
jgi:hypothetical protein